MLKLIYIVVGEVLLEWTSDIVRLLTRCLVVAVCRFHSLFGLPGDQHRVDILLDCLIESDALLKEQALLLLLLLSLLSLLLLPLVFLVGRLSWIDLGLSSGRS